MNFLEAMERMTPEVALSHLDNPRAVLATVKLWWHSLPEGERLCFAAELQTHGAGSSLFWLYLHEIFRRGITPSQWVEGIQRNDWHTQKRMREKRVKN